MSKRVIEARDISKRYRLGQLGNSPLTRFLRWVGRKPAPKPAATEFWALKDVGFDVHEGESLGIVGQNGAGKSTLLKVLSRITHPTTGRVTMRGRVASLLEVGTGFHPELSGRENIYLNGSVLGMRRWEIQKRFDEIVEFAGVARFLDTPVKRYSSGMYVRLAFAVAAHLEPEILIVDEVLAVGDVAFQQKCLGRMQSLAHSGRTVLFVSHNLAAINHFCGRAIRLQNGELVDEGDAQDVTARYIAESYSSERFCEFPRDPSKRMQIRSIELRGAPEGPGGVVSRSKPFEIIVAYDVNETMVGAEVGLIIERSDGVQVCQTRDTDNTRADIVSRAPGRYQARIEFPGGLLNVGNFSIRAVIEAGVGVDKIDAQAGMAFDLYDDEGKIAVRTSRRPRQSVLHLDLPWACCQVDAQQPSMTPASETASVGA